MTSSQPARFTPATLAFLHELRSNNNREWFNDNKQRYLDEVVDPALTFIAAMQSRLKQVSAHFTAVPKRTGGSLMRVYRDTRFGADKTPYKTNIGIQFRHELGKDVHAPGFYVHVEADSAFLAAGIWRPDPKVLARLREAIADNPNAWRKVRDDRRFAARFALGGDSLKRAPQGYAVDHPLIDDLKRKDFIAIENLEVEAALQDNFADRVQQSFTSAKPLMRFLCRAQPLAF